MPDRCFINVKSPLTWVHYRQECFLSAGRYEAGPVEGGRHGKESVGSWIIRGNSRTESMSAGTFDTFTSIGAIERE